MNVVVLGACKDGEYEETKIGARERTILVIL